MTDHPLAQSHSDEIVSSGSRTNTSTGSHHNIEIDYADVDDIPKDRDTRIKAERLAKVIGVNVAKLQYNGAQRQIARDIERRLLSKERKDAEYRVVMEPLADNPELQKIPKKNKQFIRDNHDLLDEIYAHEREKHAKEW